MLLEAFAFEECRVRQAAVDTITVEIGGRECITPDEEEKRSACSFQAPSRNFRALPPHGNNLYPFWLVWYNLSARLREARTAKE
jgi:hypothetical protein